MQTGAWRRNATRRVNDFVCAHRGGSPAETKGLQWCVDVRQVGKTHNSTTPQMQSIFPSVSYLPLGSPSGVKQQGRGGCSKGTHSAWKSTIGRCDTAASIVPSNVSEDAKGSQAAVERLMHSCFSERPSVGCFRCFVSLKKTSQLCAGYKMSTFHFTNVDRCFTTLDRIFNDNPKVIEAGAVGRAYEAQLQNIMKSQILPLVNEFHQTTNYDIVYESRLQTAADNFIAEASKLPRATGCIPPCGFQTADGHYDCVKCKKDFCNFPLDCPVENRTVEENNPVQMLCDVSFTLPQNTKIMKIWKFAEQVETRQMELFEEVTVGEDNLYSISSTRTHHQGTYQCEIYSDEISIARIYYYLTVTPHVVTGHSELQEIFELSLLPGGRLHAESPRPSQYLPSSVLIAICFTSLLLLLILSLGTIFLEKARGTERTRRNEDL